MVIGGFILCSLRRRKFFSSTERRSLDLGDDERDVVVLLQQALPFLDLLDHVAVDGFGRARARLASGLRLWDAADCRCYSVQALTQENPREGSTQIVWSPDTRPAMEGVLPSTFRPLRSRLGSQWT